MGVAMRDAFIAKVTTIVGGSDYMRLLWLPRPTDTTTTTSAEKDARVFTHNATIATRMSPLGSGLAITFNGTNNEATVPDADDFSYGDGLNDSPFSIVALVNVTDTAAVRFILGKRADTSGAELREWDFFVDASDRLNMTMHDETANANIRRLGSVAITQGSWQMFTGTYDGTRAPSGIALYANEARIDDTTSTSGSYVAMSNTSTVVRLGSRLGTAAADVFFSGSMAFVMLVARQLQPDEIYALMAACNSHFDLTLS